MGGARIVISIAGPVRGWNRSSRNVTIAREVKERGAKVLRGGAFKAADVAVRVPGPRHEDGLQVLAAARATETGLPW